MDKKDDTGLPLVSVIVPAYNSSDTIIETLDSIREQTYKHFEVIICDDASKDSTVQTCQSWLERNSVFSIFFKLLTSKENAGTCKNLNNAISQAHGAWIKIIAADDHLLPNCLQDNVNFIARHPDTDLLFSTARPIGLQERNEKREWVGDRGKLFYTLNKRQFKIALLCKNFLTAASAFIKMELFKEMGGFDENLVLVEDWPFWMKVVDRGHVLRYMPAETVEYRLSDVSVSHNFHNPVFMSDRKKAWHLSLGYMSKISLFSKIYVKSMLRLDEKPNVFNHFLHALNVVNPFYWEVRRARKNLNGYL